MTKKLLNCAVIMIMAQFIFSCQAQKKYIHCGMVEVMQRYYDTTQKKYVMPANDRDRKIWYRDSLVIQEVFHLYQNEDENHHVTWMVIVERYKFIDLKTKDIYEYFTFSDTAKLIKKCTPMDANCIGECWKFWDDYDFMDTGRISKLPDTMITKRRYSRYNRMLAVESKTGIVTESLIAYLDCDRKNGLIMLNAPFSKKKNCPVTRVDVIYPPGTYLNTKIEILYHDKGLTKAELKVFDAWEKNAKMYKEK